MMTSAELASLFIENHLSIEECLELAEHGKVVTNTAEGPVEISRDAYGKFWIERSDIPPAD